MRIWDPATGQQRATLTGHAGAVDAVAIAPDGTWLASASCDGTVRIWDPATGQQRATLTGHTGAVTAVAIAPDGTWLATGSDDGTVRIWDPATGQQRATLTGHTGRWTAVAIAPDGTWLATGSDDGTVRIWDPATGQQRATLDRPHRRGGGGGDRPGRHLAGHRQRRRDGADLGPGHRPAARHPHRPHRRGVRRWRSPRTAPGWPPPAATGRCGSGTADGTPRATLTGHAAPLFQRVVQAVAIAPDGTWLATAS